MNKENVKSEFIKRYRYIYGNALFILAPYICENKPYNKNIKASIYLNVLPKDLLLSIESFLLSDVPFEKSKLYKYVESNKNNIEYLQQYKNGIKLLEIKNKKNEFEFLKLNLNCKYLLELVYIFIERQSRDTKNRDNKLLVIDEYARVNRYKNDGKIWTSGVYQTFKDISNYINYNFSIIMLNNKEITMRDKNDIGLKRGVFINYISNFDNHYGYNSSILTEEEKQIIYLNTHDELPWDLEIKCIFNNDTLERPNNTRPCFGLFKVKEEDIFINYNSKDYRYYHICPHCGFIVNIPENILTEGIKKRIEDRCKKDFMLFRKMELYSELYSLDEKVRPGQRKILKK